MADGATLTTPADISMDSGSTLNIGTGGTAAIDLAVELDAAHITNLATGQVLQATPLSATALEILAAGGLVPYARRKLAQRASATAA